MIIVSISCIAVGSYELIRLEGPKPAAHCDAQTAVSRRVCGGVLALELILSGIHTKELEEALVDIGLFYIFCPISSL